MSNYNDFDLDNSSDIFSYFDGLTEDKIAHAEVISFDFFDTLFPEDKSCYSPEEIYCQVTAMGLLTAYFPETQVKEPKDSFDAPRSETKVTL